MIFWGLILFSISVGRLLDNIVGIGNVWGNVITLTLGFVATVVGMYRKGLQIEKRAAIMSPVYKHEESNGRCKLCGDIWPCALANWWSSYTEQDSKEDKEKK